MHEIISLPSDAYLGEGDDRRRNSYWAPTHANGRSTGTTNYFSPTHGITSHTYLYPASQTSDTAIVANVSNSVSYVNYTAHGSGTSWADPLSPSPISTTCRM